MDFLLCGLCSRVSFVWIEKESDGTVKRKIASLVMTTFKEFIKQ